MTEQQAGILQANKTLLTATMSTHKETCDTFLGLAKRRIGTLGTWIPAQCWIEKMDIAKLDNKRLMKALETCGIYKVKVTDKTHGFLYIEIVKRNIDAVGKRWFICVSSETKPDVHSSKLTGDLFGKVLHASWNRHMSAVANEEEDDDKVVLETQLPTQPTPLPPQPSPPQVTATRTTVSPSPESPQVLRDDGDLLELFRGILSDQCLLKDDLFRPEVTADSLKERIKSFGKRLDAAGLVKHYDFFYDTSVPETHAVNDIATLDHCPCLKKHNIPMSVPAMSEVATATHNLSELVPEVLHLPKQSGSKGFGKRLVAIVPSTDKKRLCYNTKQWMESITSASTVDATDETLSVDAHTVVKTFVRVLHTIDSVAVEDAADDLSTTGSSRWKLKLDPELQQGMFFEANLSLSQMQIIKKYLCYSNLDVLQPESVMKNVQVTDFVRPIPVEFREGKGNRRRVTWTVPIIDLLTFNATKALKAKSFAHKNLQFAHVILVGDHGQGAFRMMVTLLLITRQQRRTRRSTVNKHIGSESAFETDGHCGHMQCQKDTYQVIKDTIAEPINSDVLSIMSKGRVTMCTAPDESIKLCFGNIHTTQGVELASAPAEVFMVGDLAFCSLMLGKESMAPHWCWRCPMSKAEWTDRAPGEPRVADDWTCESMTAHCDKLESGELNTSKSEQVRGVTQRALTGTPPKNVIAPSLHNNELFVNHPINKGLMRWIHRRIEQLPLEIIDARLECVDLEIQKEDAVTGLAEAKSDKEFLKAELQSLKPPKRNGVFRFRDAQHETDFANSTALFEQAKERVNECNKVLASVGRELKQAKAEVKAVSKKKEHGALSQQVRQDIEDMLQLVYSILRSAYHGGDFEGNHCRKFIRKSNNVMDSIETILLQVPEANRAADDEEIRKCCRAHKRLFQCFDALVHCCNQPFGALSDQDMIDVNKLVDMLDRLWRKLFHTVPPKAHAWWHLLQDLERFRGLKHHSESKIEKAHQTGRKIDLLFRAVNDIDKKIESSFRHQHTAAKPSMQVVQRTVKESRSKKRTSAVLAR